MRFPAHSGDGVSFPVVIVTLEEALGVAGWDSTVRNIFCRRVVISSLMGSGKFSEKITRVASALGEAALPVSI